MPGAFRAVLFDLDGTLYHQRPLRLAMAIELLVFLGARSPSRAARVIRILAAYRQLHEELRTAGESVEPLARRQVNETAARVEVPPREVEAVITEWMLVRPMRYLRWCRRGDLVSALAHLASRGVRLGVLSDYPVRDKLNALGVAESFSLALCTTDPEINALKPHPRGFKRACELWHLHPEEILYVGDRVDVDEKGARAAGLQFAILGHRNERRPSDSVVVPHLRSLAEAFP